MSTKNEGGSIVCRIFRKKKENESYKDIKYREINNFCDYQKLEKEIEEKLCSENMLDEEIEYDCAKDFSEKLPSVNLSDEEIEFKEIYDDIKEREKKTKRENTVLNNFPSIILLANIWISCLLGQNDIFKLAVMGGSIVIMIVIRISTLRNLKKEDNEIDYIQKNKNIIKEKIKKSELNREIYNNISDIENKINKENQDKERELTIYYPVLTIFISVVFPVFIEYILNIEYIKNSVFLVFIIILVLMLVELAIILVIVNYNERNIKNYNDIINFYDIIQKILQKKLEESSLQENTKTGIQQLNLILQQQINLLNEQIEYLECKLFETLSEKKKVEEIISSYTSLTENGVKGIIHMGKKFGISNEDILNSLQEYLGISLEESRKYLNEFSNN